MSTALGRVAQELSSELFAAGIEVRGDDYMIIVGDTATRIDKYTDARKCRALLKKLIKREKKRIFEETQGTLL